MSINEVYIKKFTKLAKYFDNEVIPKILRAKRNGMSEVHLHLKSSNADEVAIFELLIKLNGLYRYEPNRLGIYYGNPNNHTYTIKI